MLIGVDTGLPERARGFRPVARQEVLDLRSAMPAIWLDQKASCPVTPSSASGPTSPSTMSAGSVAVAVTSQRPAARLAGYLPSGHAVSRKGVAAMRSSRPACVDIAAELAGLRVASCLSSAANSRLNGPRGS